MDSKVHLTVRDYVTWSLIVGIVFLGCRLETGGAAASHQP